MKTRLLIFIILTLIPVMVFGARDKKDSVKVVKRFKNEMVIKQTTGGINNYNPERGFFQKAYTDASDPRFMIANEDDSFSFGIGGAVTLNTGYGFSGSVNNEGFKTYNIEVPTYYAGSYFINTDGSRLNFKSRLKIRQQKLITFVEIGFNTSNQFVLRHAYASIAGLTFGYTYSFFMDMKAGPMTVDTQGPNTQIFCKHAIIGYELNLLPKWTLGFSIEKPNSCISDSKLNKYGIWEEYQKMPDFVLKTSYDFGVGHIQFASVLRKIFYWKGDKLSTVGDEPDRNRTYNEFCYGLALSGHVDIIKGLMFTFQGLYGKGVGSYIQDIKDSYMNLALPVFNTDEIPRMQAIPIIGGYLSLQYSNKKFAVATNLGAVNVLKSSNVKYDVLETYKNSLYFSCGCFYNLTDYMNLGMEYLYGKRNDIMYKDPVEGHLHKGHANRIAARITVTF
ncbi:MAG: hypothetical protein KBS95_05705 [Alistipes sp.]|nr:hypothetical protein [Candidatus Alistipes equi]